MRRLALLGLPVISVVFAFACGSAGGASSDSSGASGANAGGSGDTGAGGTPGAGGVAGSGASLVGGSGGMVGKAGASGLDPDAGCAYAAFSAARVPASILIVMDRSGSMSDPATKGGSGSKWDSAVTALDGALDAAADDLEMGIERFPEGKFDDSLLPVCLLQNPLTPQCKALLDDGGCKDIVTTPNVVVGPLSMTRKPIEQFLGSTKPNGNTPTLWALKNAWDYMAKYPAKGDRYVLLVTDGIPTFHTPAMLGLPEMNLECGVLGDLGTATTAARMGTPPVKTFVIGVPGDNDAQILSGIAYLGGTGKPGCDFNSGDCHFQIGASNFQKDLQDALTTITGKVSNCVFEVPKGMNADPAFVNVELDTPTGASAVLKDPTHMDGWDYTDDTDSKIELFGPSCDAIKTTASSKVQVLFGCATMLK
jgi:hypothetical protein